MDPMEPKQSQTTSKTQAPSDTRSVYVADKDKVINVPSDFTKDQTDFAVQTGVREKSPEDFYLNWQPVEDLKNAFKEYVKNPLDPLKDLKVIAGTALKWEEQMISPAMKFLVTRPDVAFGFAKQVNQKDIQDTYKPWLDLWRESEVGRTATKVSDKALADLPLPVAAVPWFFQEFLPEQLLSFGTKASSWAVAYGIEKTAPAVIDSTMRLLPKKLRSDLLTDVFNIEAKNEASFKTLGVKRGASNVELQNARNNLAKEFHPDKGGDPAKMSDINTAYDKIMADRQGWLYKVFKHVQQNTGAAPVSPKAQAEKLGIPYEKYVQQRGSVEIGISDGDLVKVGDQVGQVVKKAGEMALVNLAGKPMMMSIGELQKVPRVGEKKFAELQQKFDQNLDKADYFPGTEEDVNAIRGNIDHALSSYEKASMVEYKTNRPVVSSGDLPKTMDLPYRPKFKSEDSVSRHAAASSLSKIFDEQRLTDPATKDLPTMLLGGISGAGKSVATKNMGDLSDEYALVKDTNISNFNSRKKFIEKSLAAGHDVDVVYVNREPTEAFIDGVYRRFQTHDERRIVTIPIHNRNAGSLDAIIQLADYYKNDGRVSFRFLDNKTGKQPVEISVDDLRGIKLDLNKSNAEIKDFLQKELKNGKLSQSEYQTFLGESAQGQTEPGGGTVQGSAAPGQIEKGVGAVPEGTGIKPPVTPPAAPPTAPEEGGESAVNLDRIKTTQDAKEQLIKATDVIKDELDKFSGRPLTHEEVIEAAKEANVIKGGVSREATLNFQAALLKTRQHLTALAEQNELTPEFIDTLKVTAELGTDIARNLESFKIEAIPEFASVKIKIIKDLLKLGKTSDEIMAAAKGVDFKDQESVATFYRKFVKPKLSDQLNEFAYMNILSSPKTHIVNTFSNMLQLIGLNPLTRLATGAVDQIASGLTGKARTHYFSEVPAFYRGAANALPKAFEALSQAMKGKVYLERPDVKHLPTKSKWIDYATLGLGKYVTRALEGSDVFFRTMIQEGEVQALTERLGHAPSDKEMVQIQKEARDRAEYYVFRKKPDAQNKTGQGAVLSAIDQLTNAVYRIREVPGAKWLIRFVQTPMNIAKQGLEYSPLGASTILGAEDKAEQAGKAALGSMVFALGSFFAMSGRSTWKAPTNPTEKALFYQSGRQPYSFKIGDTWVSYSKLGPLAYPLAMTSALHYYAKESPNALSDGGMDKAMDVIGGILGFFGDQSYVQPLGDLARTLQGDKTSINRLLTSIPSQLIPLSSLQGWVNSLIDPVYRKSPKGLSPEAILQGMMKKIVGLSKMLPEQKDIFGRTQKNDMNVANAVSPLALKKEDKAGAKMYAANQRSQQLANKYKKQAEDIAARRSK